MQVWWVVAQVQWNGRTGKRGERSKQPMMQDLPSNTVVQAAGYTSTCPTQFGHLPCFCVSYSPASFSRQSHTHHFFAGALFWERSQGRAPAEPSPPAAAGEPAASEAARPARPPGMDSVR